MANLNGANAYFAKTIRNADWLNFEEALRETAICADPALSTQTTRPMSRH